MFQFSLQLTHGMFQFYSKFPTYCGIQKTLTHHVARHTFATTILLDGGIDLKTVSFFMGHSSIKSTEVYGKITRNRAVTVIKLLDKSHIAEKPGKISNHNLVT